MSNITFTLSNKEAENVDIWLDEHNKKCKLKKKNKTRYLTYSFTPVGIGTSIEVRCSCGKSKDITDSSSW